MKQVKIFDTTLRDGEQAPGCSMNLDEKIEVARVLEALSVDVMEAGFAVSSKGDFESVKTIAETVKESGVCSLARAVKKDIDAAYEALKKAAAPRIHIFLATSPLHMQYKLKMNEAQVLDSIRESVSYAKKYLSDVEFSAEDATRSDRAFLVKALEQAIRAGATTLNIPDTVGYRTPWEMADLIRYLRAEVKGIEGVDVSVHCHNDLGMGVANSLAAVDAGATQIECTINGIGERAGNAALEEVVMGLKTRKNLFQAESRIDSTQIYRASKLIYSLIGMRTPINKAVVGRNAFAHESGIHQHGVLANPETYEIMTPESVGIPANDNMVFGKHSGKHAIENRLVSLGHRLSKEEIEIFFEKFKDLADKKKSINDRDLEALLGYGKTEVKKGYRLDRFTVNSGNYVTSNAVVRLQDGDQLKEEVAIGDGPVDAAFRAIDKIAGTEHVILDDYVIRSVGEGNDALGEVSVKLRDKDRIVTGKGLSTDVIESSILAYINGVNKLL